MHTALKISGEASSGTHFVDMVQVDMLCVGVAGMVKTENRRTSAMTRVMHSSDMHEERHAIMVALPNPRR